MRPPSAEPRDLLRGPAAAGAAARRRPRRPPRRRVPPCPSATWRTIARPEAGAGPATRGVGAEEAVEDLIAIIGAIPGPRSRTVSSPSCRRTSTTPPGGLHFAALSSRFATARSSRAGTPCTSAGSSWVSNVTAGACRRARSTAAATRRSSRTSSTAGALGLLVAGELDEVADERAQLLQLRDEVRAQAVAVAGVRRAAPGSTSRFVRSEVSGVRSSCEASATSWRWAR